MPQPGFARAGKIGVGAGLLDPPPGMMPTVRPKLRPPPASALPVLGIVLAAGLLAVQYASQAREWAVMTDELQTSKLATSIAQTLSPVPHIHGEYYGALNQLYPLLLSPLYRWLSAPAAFDGAHVLNAFLLASSAWPAYLLGRAVTGRVGGGYFAAAVTAFTPWLVLSSTLLTENAAYPAFVWAVFLCYRALVEPSAGRDAAGVAPFLLATAWAFTPSRREAQAFAVLLVPLAALLTLEAASFDLRFTPGGFTQDRYVCYLAPLFAVGAAACLLDPGRRALRAGLVLVAGLAFLGLAAAESFDEEITLWWASPAGGFHRALRGAADAIGLSADELVRYGGLVLAAALAGALWRLPARL